ncbi:MAG: hypothetical protein ACLR6O_07140 [Eubacterium sp.]
MRGKNFGHNKLVIAGGVSAIQSFVPTHLNVQKHNWRLYLPELKYCGDNGAMIAAQGYYEFVANHTADESLNAYATMPRTM